MKRLLLLLLLFFAGTAFAGTGTFTEYTTTWNGLTRHYAVYVPRNLLANAPMVVMLHPTSAATSLPYELVKEWEPLSDQFGFLLVGPVSTFNTRSNQWYWDCFFMDFSFPLYPDDAGYVRNLIETLSSKYFTDPNRVFVAGMSSGAFMTHRMGAESSDLIAAIAPVSGMIDVEQIGATFELPNIAKPISVLDMQGDKDGTVRYCGGHRSYWLENNLSLPSLDTTAAYWRTQNSCTDKVPRLCTNGQPSTGVDGLDAVSCTNGVEVKFVREVGVGHVWVPGTEDKLWAFFQTHGR